MLSQNHPRGLVKSQLAGSYPGNSNSVGLGVVPILCISIKFPGDTLAALITSKHLIFNKLVPRGSVRKLGYSWQGPALRGTTYLGSC